MEELVLNTFRFLSESSKSKSIPHKVTHNLGSLSYHLNPTKPRSRERRVSLYDAGSVVSLSHPELFPIMSWLPQYPDHVGSALNARLLTKEKAEDRGEGLLNRCAWGALGEVVGMAERTAGISLGRVQRQRRGKLPS